ncbi:hypothetical protein ACFQHW_09930 [Lapidilactobacillus achengensis]|uniref:Major facilitator superfamily (MFS) profile domain-containing protein n=1 Tax=Lapidilactobacillus achengensis TaxID=2486000 RepID=A0ABW1UPK3_9LACO|nr:hypothetical protein [Lapidilactobacillus achengensis]
MRGSQSIDDSLPVGVSAQMTMVTLSRWSGAGVGGLFVGCSLAGGRSGWG